MICFRVCALCDPQTSHLSSKFWELPLTDPGKVSSLGLEFIVRGLKNVWEGLSYSWMGIESLQEIAPSDEMLEM